jgi:hypothetical protein
MPAIRTLIALLLCASASLGGELQTLSGKILAGDLVSLSDKELIFRGPTGNVTTPIADVLQLELVRDTALPNGAKYTDIEMIDGTVLHCAKFALKGKNVEATLVGSNLKVTFPLTIVASILKDAEDSAVKQEWQDKVIAKRGNTDILAVKVLGVFNALEGTLGDTATDKGKLVFSFEIGGKQQTKEVDPTVAQGMAFLRTLGSDAPPALCKVFDTNQNVLMAAKLALGPNGFTVTTIAGAKIELPRPQVARLDYSNDKIVFLSDIKPADLVEKSKQGRKDTLKLNKNLENGALQIEDQVYSKGLAIHAHTELVYNLEGKYQKFEAVLGMDATVGGDGKPQVTIEADGNKLFSETVSRKDKRRELNFPVKGVKQLRIVVTSSGLLDFGDHVDLANAKLSK